MEEEEKEIAVLVPDNFRAKTTSFIKARVVDWADDINIQMHENAIVVVNSSMIEEIVLGDEKYHLILENYVLGYF